MFPFYWENTKLLFNLSQILEFLLLFIFGILFVLIIQEK